MIGTSHPRRSRTSHAAWCARAASLLPHLGDEEACELRIAMLSGTTQRLAELVRSYSARAIWPKPSDEA